MADRDDWRAEAERAIGTAAPADLPALAGELARLEALLAQRLTANGTADAPPRAYTAAQVAELLNRDVSWVRRHGNLLGAIRADGAVLYPEAVLRRFLEQPP